MQLDHVDVQEESNDDLVDTAAATTATQAANTATQATHIIEGTATDVENVDKEVSPTAQFVEPNGAELEGADRPLIVREEGMTHSNPRIQHDLDLWQKIKEYDKSSSENPFVPVLSKKQKQMLKELPFDGKAPYRTRSTGEASPLAQ